MSRPQSPASSDSGRGASAVTREIAAEAAVWIARLHGPDRSPQMERECRAWQARSEAHRTAFERCTDTWEEVARITVGDAYATANLQRAQTAAANRTSRARRSRWALAFGIAVLLVLGAAAALVWRNFGAYSTGVGEQQLVVLDDGTRMSLNTDTHVRVRMGSERRTVNVDGGEALFEVAKDPHRPFVVRAAGSEVVAVGTVFSVRLTTQGPVDDALAVTLIEGHVTLQAASASASGGLVPAKPLSMQPGERARLVRGGGSPDQVVAAQVDRPRIESLVAWKRNEAVFDDVSLADAVAELNRYNRTPIVLVGDAALGTLRVSGVFRTGDTASFARDVAALHGLVVREGPGRLELAAPH